MIYAVLLFDNTKLPIFGMKKILVYKRVPVSFCIALALK